MRHKFKEEKFANSYEKRLSDEGYPGSLLDVILDELENDNTVIDVGAGTGFFSIPLAERGYRVSAVEPSNEMVRIFNNKIDEELSRLIRLYPMNWESWEGEMAEALICIHSIYGMKDLSGAIKKMKSYAGKSALIIKAESGTRSLSELIREKLKKNRSYSSFFNKVRTALNEYGIQYKYREIEQRRDSRFTDLTKEVEYYCDHLGIENNRFDLVKDIIKDNSERYGDEFVFRSLYRDILIVF